MSAETETEPTRSFKEPAARPRQHVRETNEAIDALCLIKQTALKWSIRWQEFVLLSSQGGRKLAKLQSLQDSFFQRVKDSAVPVSSTVRRIVEEYVRVIMHFTNVVIFFRKNGPLRNHTSYT